MARHVDQVERVEVRRLVSEAIELIDIERFVTGEMGSSSLRLSPARSEVRPLRSAKKQLLRRHNV
jgi:hypothetical protein